MRVLCVDPFGGIAGDMFLAAALDLRQPAFGLDDLRAFAQAILPGECALAAHEVRRGAFRGLWLDVRTVESADPPERHLDELLAILEHAPLGPTSRARATRLLERLARAEAEVHGTTIDEVHFHELGAVDTLIDVAGASFALERLEVEGCRVAPAYVGGGTVDTAHGRLPVPTPGTAALLRGLASVAGPGGERVTPTGASLLCEFASGFDPAGPGALAVRAIGYGAGSRDPREGPPNLVRVSLAEASAARADEPARAEVVLLEANLDDATGEEVGFLLGELRAGGALEAWACAVQMKKDRPGVVVCALAREERRAALEALFFRHSPTLGVRSSAWQRVEARREELAIELEGRCVRVKVRRVAGQPALLSDVSPEYDDLAELARATGRPLRELALLAQRAAFEALGR